jgi:hypothetical protein
MIWTTKLVSRALRFSHDRCGVVTANVEEAPQNVIVATYHDDRFSRNLAGNVLSGFAELINPTNQLPGMREDGAHLELVKHLVCIPRRGNSRRLLQRRAWIVALDDFSEGRGHHQLRGFRSAASPPDVRKGSAFPQELNFDHLRGYASRLWRCSLRISDTA